jgi:hypothetical protein
MKVIYDVGANNGDDIQYYLLKADLVVAIEANPTMTEIIKHRFQAEIASDRLRIVPSPRMSRLKPYHFTYIRRIPCKANSLVHPNHRLQISMKSL